MKYMKKLLLTSACVVVLTAMTGCGDDTMNSATYGEDEMDNVIDDAKDDGEDFMDSLENGVDDVIHGTEDALDDIGNGLEDDVNNMNGDVYNNEGVYDDGDMEPTDSDLEDRE